MCLDIQQKSKKDYTFWKCDCLQTLECVLSKSLETKLIKTQTTVL